MKDKNTVVVKGKKDPTPLERVEIDKPMSLREARRLLQRKGLSASKGPLKVKYDYPWQDIEHLIPALKPTTKSTELLNEMARVIDVEALQKWLKQPKPILLIIDHCLFEELVAIPEGDETFKFPSEEDQLILVEHHHVIGNELKERTYTMYYQEDIICWVYLPDKKDWQGISINAYLNNNPNAPYVPVQFHNYILKSFELTPYKFQVVKSHKTLPRHSRSFKMMTCKNRYKATALDLKENDEVIDAFFDDEENQFIYIIERL